MKPRAIVTCGPTFEPIDAVRRITNFATGQIGAVLSDALSAEGFDVVCLRGEMSTHPALPENARLETFTTVEDLATRMMSHASDRQPAACILHAAAVGDFIVSREGIPPGRKISSREAEIMLRLVPAPKILRSLRTAFPAAIIVGWKYELDGGRNAVITKGAAQIQECRTDGCVINGAAYGKGFGFLKPCGALTHFAAKPELAQFLARWVRALSASRADGLL